MHLFETFNSLATETAAIAFNKLCLPFREKFKVSYIFMFFFSLTIIDFFLTVVTKSPFGGLNP